MLCKFFYSPGEQELLSSYDSSCNMGASHCGGFACGTGTLGCTASVVTAPRVYSTDSVVVTHRLSCSGVCGILPDWGSNPCLLHWQMDSLPLSHQRSPCLCSFSSIIHCSLIIIFNLDLLLRIFML